VRMRLRLSVSVLVVLGVILAVRYWVPQPVVPFIEAQELAEKIDAGESVTVVDARDASHYKRGRIPGSFLVSSQDLQGWIHRFNASKEIVVVCETGREGARLVQRLMEAGFDDAKYLRGGFRLWKGPLESDG